MVATCDFFDFFHQNNIASLPSNPKRDLIVKLEPDDLRGLEDKDMLHMNILDFILFLTCAHYNDTNAINYCLGGKELLPRMLRPISNPNADKKLRKSVQCLMDLMD